MKAGSTQSLGGSIISGTTDAILYTGFKRDYPKVSDNLLRKHITEGYSGRQIRNRIESSRDYHRLMSLSKSEVLSRVNTTRVDNARSLRSEPKREIVLAIINNKYGSRTLGEVDSMGGLMTRKELGL